jgi:hypothetical protein
MLCARLWRTLAAITHYREEAIMNRIWAALALSALSSTTAWADAASGHAGSAHPADALKDKAPANVGNKPALPPGVTPSTRKVHAGHEHPVIEARDHEQPSATEMKPALPPGVKPSTRKVHAGQEHPVIEGHDHAQLTATEQKPALPPGVRPSTRKVHAGQEHPTIESHDHVQPSATEMKPALPPGVRR